MELGNGSRGLAKPLTIFRAWLAQNCIPVRVSFALSYGHKKIFGKCEKNETPSPCFASFVNAIL